MISLSVRKAKVTRLIDFLEREASARSHIIAARQSSLAEARQGAQYIDAMHQTGSGGPSIFHDHHVKYRYRLESKITELSGEIDRFASEVRNLEKAAGELKLRLKKLERSEAAKAAEIELSEFIARQSALPAGKSALGKARGAVSVWPSN